MSLTLYDLEVAYIERLIDNLLCKALMLVEAWRCVYLVLSTVLVFVPAREALPGI
jgi:hypothetical protein